MHNDAGTAVAFVCCVCDEFIIRKRDISIISIQKMKRAGPLLSWKNNVSSSERIPNVEKYYRFPEVEELFNTDQTWLDEMALSPRGSMSQLSKHASFGFVSCSECKECIESQRMPVHAVANHNHVGCPPHELLDLNDIERSFLTPIRLYGYFFT
jgi:hypothetical protein